MDVEGNRISGYRSKCGRRYAPPVQFRAPTRPYAFVLAMVSGTLLSIGHYAGGAMAAAIAIVPLALANFADSRGDDRPHDPLATRRGEQRGVRLPELTLAEPTPSRGLGVERTRRGDPPAPVAPHDEHPHRRARRWRRAVELGIGR
jgi:hypothetical protein